MTPAEAARFLNTQVAWEPGLTVRAVARQDCQDVTVMLTRKVTDSSSVRPDGTYPDPAQARPESPDPYYHAYGRLSDLYGDHFALVPQPAAVGMTREFSGSQLDTPAVLLACVIRAVAEMHLHDIREFTRLRPASPGGKWEAPFHPHNASGELLWQHGGRVPQGLEVKEEGKS